MKGQVSIEAIISLATYLAIISVFLHLSINLSEQAGTSGNSLLAESNAQKCASLVDALFSNSGGIVSNIKLNCFAEEEHKVKANVEGKEKEAFVLPKKVKLVQAGNETVLEVSVNEHYR